MCCPNAHGCGRIIPLILLLSTNGWFLITNPDDRSVLCITPMVDPEDNAVRTRALPPLP